MTVVYFPASRSDRSARFLSSILTDYASVFSSSPSRSIILGDFHHTYFNASSYRNRQALAPWLEYLDDHFVNGITAPGANPSITSRRGSTQSCICCLLYNMNTATPHTYSQRRLYPSTDASPTSSVGKGLWRIHPLLASNSTLAPQKDTSGSTSTQLLVPLTAVFQCSSSCQDGGVR
ncbi:hypothetical protein FB192DRAFT_1373269 [Mucor lusitanicus]|uniref:Endonuclease/exonuclease/phosphatase domain-containing protein n=1 Tax=Mucor circinelloides f. lusitanicus TaxID=29924 RepID=A0A8H4F1I3_MUCCL|nr:hypothetical protein FB192DRAFT_1373167 [Mucor lusitanicus]KAF1801537.1 hypothetical protein FB192DRAFT_1373269 [Mucor lusitanicus]